MKCNNCETELFESDIVDSSFEYGYTVPKEKRELESDGRGMQYTESTYRCPKCFKIKKVKLKTNFYD